MRYLLLLTLLALVAYTCSPSPRVPARTIQGFVERDNSAISGPYLIENVDKE